MAEGKSAGNYFVVGSGIYRYCTRVVPIGSVNRKIYRNLSRGDNRPVGKMRELRKEGAYRAGCTKIVDNVTR